MLQGKGEGDGAEGEGIHWRARERAQKCSCYSLVHSSPNARARTPKAKYLKAMLCFGVCLYVCSVSFRFWFH